MAFALKVQPMWKILQSPNVAMFGLEYWGLKTSYSNIVYIFQSGKKSLYLFY